MNDWSWLVYVPLGLVAAAMGFDAIRQLRRRQAKERRLRARIDAIINTREGQ